jgi:serine/threonine protein kinase
MSTDSLLEDPVIVGAGTYGNVYRATNYKGEYVAVKQNLLEKEIDFIGSIKEADILVRLRGHPNIVSLKSLSMGSPLAKRNKPERGVKEDDLFFVLEYLGSDLHNLLNSSHYNWSRIGNYITQILLAVEYMHGQSIAHRDIKPSNILWDRKRDILKLCDFGMSRTMDNQGDGSPRVVTCWYRAPEIINGQPYDTRSDMWSVGLVIAEMLTRQAILKGATDNDRRLARHIEKFKDLTSDKLLTILDLPFDHPLFSWDHHYRIRFLDMLVGLLQIDPSRRWTATKCLNSPFFIPYSTLIKETRTNHPIKVPDYRRRIIPGRVRECGLNIAYTLFNYRSNLDWYRHRIVFMAIDLFDRYLCYLADKGTPSHNELVAELRFMVCLYVSVKYHLTMSIPPSFYELVDIDKVRRIIELSTDELGECRDERIDAVIAKMERELLADVLRFHVYHPTPFCLRERMDDAQVKNLLLALGNVPVEYDIREIR